MTGHNSFCDDGSSLDATVACGQQDPFILTLRQASNRGEDFGSFTAGGNSIQQQDVTNLAVLHKSHKAYPFSGFPLCKVQINAGLNSAVSSARPIATSGCTEGNVSRLPDMEPGIAEYAQGNVDLALSIVPYKEPVTAECVRRNDDFVGNCTPYDNPIPPVSRHLASPTIPSRPDLEQGRPDMSMLNNPPRQPSTAGFSRTSNIHRYVYDLCLAQADDANRACHNTLLVSHNSATGGEYFAQNNTANQSPDHVRLDNIVTHGRTTREQSFSAPLPTAGANIGDKKLLTGLHLPDSLTRSFDSSEMDKITKAIVRVNEFGSSLATNSASKQGNMPAFAQEPGDGRVVGSLKKMTPRVLPSVGAFTVQCAKCFKWRLVPSKEQYEQIRQHILEKPFFCSSTSVWQPGASCEDPPELCEDPNFVWAIDKPNIPLAPSGWERLLVIRSEGCSKFADIYYVAPSGKKLRSMPDIERYLSEHPELVNAGVSLSQFSFVIPRALDENYCRKKALGSSSVMRGSITHKSTPAYNLGVRSQPLKVPYVRNFPAEHFDLTDSAAQPWQPATGQSSVNCPVNAPLVIEPLQAWDSDNHAMMVACHAAVALESRANA